MGTNERFKLNQIVFWAISYKCTKSLIYLNKIENEIELFKINSSFGKGVAYFTTLNAAQRLINLSLVINLLSNDKFYLNKLKLKIEKLAYMEFMYVRKYNTFYYIKRNNHFICELVSLILFLKSTNIRFKK